MFTSHIPGRVRLHHPALTDAATADKVRAALGMVPGLTEASINTRTGSLLLLYDPEKLAPDSLPGLVEGFAAQLGLAAPKAPPKVDRSWTVLEKRLMLGLWPLTILLGFLDRKRAHIYLGAAVTALTVDHVWERRKRLFK